MGTNAAFDLTKTSPFTFEAWIKSSPNGNVDEQILSKTSAAITGYFFQIGVTGGRNGRLEMALVAVWGSNDALWIYSNYGSDIRDNQWHHVAATYDGSNT